MKNIEKYEKELKKYGVYFALTKEGKLVSCNGIFCSSCSFYNCCSIKRMNWLLEEYKEPILTDEGKTYLSNLLKPYGLSAHAFAFYFSKSINSKEIYWLNIVDSEHYPIITIKVNKNSELDKLFKNIELSKKYTLEELGL